MAQSNASQHLPSSQEHYASPTKNGEGTPQGWGPHSPAGGNTDQGGAPSCNTAPATCNTPSDTLLLRAGVDSLYLSYAGELFDSTRIRLDALQTLARSKEADSQKLAQYPLEDHLFEVKDRGAFPFKYVLADRWYWLKLAGVSSERAPMAHVQLSSQALTYEGPSGVVMDLNSVMEALGTVEGSPSVSRIDLCVDFVTDSPLDNLEERAWVTRARLFDRYTVGRQFSGLSIGKGGDLSARLYNKTLEIETSGKEYMKDVWLDFGWDGSQTVWRLEFQFRRNVLRQLGLSSFRECMEALGGLWRYATEDWLRLTCPSETDTTQSRWPTHPLWGALQAADWGSEQGVYRIATPTGQPPSDKSLFVNGLSGLTSFMAREGYTDAYEAAPVFFRAAKDYHEGISHYTGLSFDDYVAQKVALKARRFNTILNEPPMGEAHPADRAVAAEYRRRSDGE